MKCSDYLDLAMKKRGLRNDRQIALELEWSSSKIFNYRHNRQMMDNEAARQIAELLDIPVWQVIADMEIERAKDEPTRKAWKMLAKMSKQGGFLHNPVCNSLFLLGVSGLFYILC